SSSSMANPFFLVDQFLFQSAHDPLHTRAARSLHQNVRWYLRQQVAVQRIHSLKGMGAITESLGRMQIGRASCRERRDSWGGGPGFHVTGVQTCALPISVQVAWRTPSSWLISSCSKARTTRSIRVLRDPFTRMCAGTCVSKWLFNASIA